MKNYVPHGSDGSRLPIFSSTQIEAQFLAAMKEAGLDFDGPIIADGQPHRFKANGDKSANSRYILHLDGVPAGNIFCWKRGINENWCAYSSEQLTVEQRAERDRRWREQQQQRESERQHSRKKATAKATDILAASQPATNDHPYLLRKQVFAYPGVMVGSWLGHQNCLLIPLQTADGQLATIQAISPDAPFTHSSKSKDFLKGGAKQGAHCVIGDLAASPVILVAEGYATAATLYEATGYAAVMACDTSGLTPVTQALKTLYPHPKTILICADNDRITEGNPGVKAATAAAKAAKVPVCIPEFADDELGSDFNDLAALHGREAVRTAIEAALAGQWKAVQNKSQPTPIDPGEPVADADAVLNELEIHNSDPLKPSPYRGTDEANAGLFIRMHGESVRFCSTWDKWLIWSGRHWQPDDTLLINTMAGDVALDIRNKATWLAKRKEQVAKQVAEQIGKSTELGLTAKETEEKTKELEKEEQRLTVLVRYFLRLASRLESVPKQATMLVATKHKVVIHHSQLDRHPFLLNTRNGTVDLRNGTLHPHDHNQLITHLSDIDYTPHAKSDQWQSFLQSVFAEDDELIQFVQRAVGYSLTGDVREQVLLICHGVGSNGKSVFLNILRKLLGNLAIQAAPDLLMIDKSRRHPTEQADLFGKRTVICQETGEGRRFNETLVKQLTGGDAIRARRMHEDFWQFEPVHKLWLSTNHKPEIRGTDHAIWRRIRLIPFNVTFSDHSTPRKNPQLEEHLISELPGILAWAIRGCLDWQQHGLGTAAAVTAATESYKQEMDVLQGFISDCCIVGKRYEAKAADLYAAYVQWSEQGGERAENQRLFGMRLTERGFRREKRHEHLWLGIGLRAKPDPSNFIEDSESF